MFYSTIHQLPLQNLKRKGDKYNFRCIIPHCLDGKSGNGQTRGWISQWKGEWWYHCYNCGNSYTYSTFLKIYFPEIYKDVVKLSFKQKTKNSLIKVNEKLQESIKTYDSFPLMSIDRLDKNHKAYQYIQNRKIPVKTWPNLFYSSNFTKFTNKMTNNRYPDWKFSDQRLVIPFRKRNKSVFAFQGREINEDGFLRYITVKIDPDYPKIYGLERLNWAKKIVVVEGPIDSLFVSNCVAFGGSDLSIENLEKFFDKTQLIICFDNEKRNTEINNKIERFLNNGYSICLWPNGLKKDINLMVIKNNLTLEEVDCIIHSNVVSGKLGLLKFRRWRKR